MATQIQATITKIDNSTQTTSLTLSFPIEDITIVESGSGAYINYAGHKYYTASTVASLVRAGLIQATIIQVGTSRQTASFQMAFPATKVRLFTVASVSGANSCLLYDKVEYFVSETLTALNTSANAGVATGSSSHSGDAAAVAFTVTHGFGSAPSQVLVSPTSSAAAAAHYVSAKTSTTFTVTFSAAPAAGTNNITFDWLVK